MTMTWGAIMKRRECASLIILALAAVPALLVAIGQVYVTGVDGIRLRRTETIDLLTEIAVLFFFISVHDLENLESNRIRTGAVLLITAGISLDPSGIHGDDPVRRVCAGAFDARRTDPQRDGPGAQMEGVPCDHRHGRTCLLWLS